MLWNVNLIGKPENVVKALDAESEKMSGASKEEFDGAKPHIVALVRENFSLKDGQDDMKCAIQVEASGSGYAYTEDGKPKTYRFCSVKIVSAGGQMV